MSFSYSQNKYPQKQTLITCHANADFDALCALIGISFFFPDAQLVFPGTQEKVVQEFYDEMIQPLFSCVSPKEANYEIVERLVVVDTQSVERLSHIKPLLIMHGILPDLRKNLNTCSADNNKFSRKRKTDFLQEQEQVLSKSSEKLNIVSLPKKNLEILAWDHHSTVTLATSGGISAFVGSSCTLVAEEFRVVFDDIPCLFANLLALGIYVDTGSFCFTSTTPRDYLATAWLREKGFTPEFVDTYITRNLNKDQFSLLNALVESAQIIDLVALRFIIAYAKVDYYVNDLASLATPFLDMNPCQVLFMVADMGDGIQIVARSKNETVDVAKICRLVGGGGHAYAASAMVKDKALPELITFLQNQISLFAHSDKVAKRLMTSPVMFVYENNTMKEANDLMHQYRLKAIPVYRTSSVICVGWLEHEVTMRAVGHGLTQLLVSNYMHRNFQVVSEETNLQKLMDIIIGERQRIVPVVKALSNNLTDADFHTNQEDALQNLPVIGVVTRTDIIRLFLDSDELQLPKPRKESNSKRNVQKMLSLNTPEPCTKLLEIAGELASEQDLSLYVVGGFVRDLLMKQDKFRWPHMDIDLVVEGDAIAFAHSLAEKLQGRVREHAEFLTALVIFKASSLDKFLDKKKTKKNKNQENQIDDFELRIDVATARLEYYHKPAALPTVELSSIRMDLTRRDFTINAMAICLNTNKFGSLVDFFDGQNDIKHKRINTLHSLSFVEDPTRSLRAVRFEQRYDFKIGVQSDKLIRNSVELGLIDQLSGKRIYTEIQIILNEDNALSCLFRLQEFNLLSAIHPALDIGNKEKQYFFEEAFKVLEWFKLLYLDEEVDLMFYFALMSSRGVSHKDLKALLERLAFIPSKIQELLDTRTRLIRAVALMDEWKQTEMYMSHLHEILRKLPIEALLFLSARKVNIDMDTQNEEMYKKLSLYIYKARLEKLEITGQDLLSLGVAQGELIGTILNEVLMAKMDSEITGYEEELYFAKQRFHFYSKKT